jgi:hypothetical protein
MHTEKGYILRNSTFHKTQSAFSKFPKGATARFKRGQWGLNGASTDRFDMEFPQWGKNYLLPFPDDYMPPDEAAN